MSLQFQGVTFHHESAVEPLLRDLDLHFDTGWTGIVGANGAGKTTLLRLACGLLVPRTGDIRSEGSAVYCPQRTDDAPAFLADFLAATGRTACRLRGEMGIEEDWLAKWPVLSHGERKRAQIAASLWLRPAVFAVDEPTNHIDADARDLLIRSLRAFHGVGLIVSHDRELLDELCDRTAWIDDRGVVVRSGGYSQTVAEADREQTAARRRRKSAKQKLQRLAREVDDRRHTAAGADRQRSKRGISSRDHDAKDRIGRARVSGKDGQAGRLTSQLDGRLEKARRAVEEARIEKRHRLGIWMPGERSQRDLLFHLPAGEIPLGNHRVLRHEDLSMRPDERIGITGPNGAGKSTLIRAVTANLDLPDGRVVYLPQEIDLAESRRVLQRIRALSNDERGQVLTIVNRLGTRPVRLLDTVEPSPGEMRKLLLALGILRRPHLVILDEPTNHLDLPAIECLEAALDESPCGLLLVSHDRVFLHRLACREWNFSLDEEMNSTLAVV